VKKLLVINGPSLNMLGKRDNSLYGSESYDALCDYISKIAAELGFSVDIFQSNHEGEIVDFIQAADKKYFACVINAAAYTHTSIAIADAVADSRIPFIEVHLTDITAREDFRKISYLAPVCKARFFGKGFESYKEAIAFIKESI